MKIIILGAGQVGSNAAQQLAREQANDVTVVDTRDEVLRDLQDRLDISTVSGNAAHPSTLLAAGTKGADLLVALTSSDEVNMVACQIAWTLFRTPTKIARIRSGDYYGRPELFGDASIPVDLAISPEQLVTEYVERLIQYPGALQVLEFADGRVLLVSMRALRGGKLVGHQLQALRAHIPNREVRVAAIYRGGRSILPEGDTTIEEHDEVFFVAAREDMRVVMKEFSSEEASVRRVVIAGAGNIGFRLAQALEDRVKVKLIERNADRSRRAAETLRNTLVLTGNAADEDLLLEENIDDADVFVAVTNAEEANILSAMLAKKLGARRVMALINKPSYAELMENGPIDIAISPQTITIGALLEHVRRGDVVRVHSLRRGAAEAIEAIVHSDGRGSPLAGKRIDEIDLPEGTTIGAVVRGNQAIMAHHDTVIEAEDHVILFLTDRRHVEDVGRLFQARHPRMNFAMAQRILGIMLMIFSLTMLPPIGVSLLYADGHWQPFVASAAIIAAAGLLLWMPARASRRDLRLRDGFLIVSVFWVFLGLAGATPLYLSDVPNLSFTDAVFEAVSGFTTTGATVIVGLDDLPKSILYYRQQIQWFGGMGIIVLAVAILPILGIGGMSLYKAETPGPMKDQKLTPRITQTAKALWAIYLALTIACVTAYWFAGMNLFDAVAHAFSTVSTAGFSPYDASLAHFDNIGVEAVATVFMFLGGASFALHFTVLQRRDIAGYWRDTEFKAYFLLVAAITAFASIYLFAMREFPTFAECLRHAAFQVVSMQTTTGLLTEGFAHWPGALPALLVLLSFVGGCAGSTTGGMKVIRWLVVFRQGVAELKQLVHPNAEVPVKLAGRPVPQRIILGVGGYFAMYLIVFAVLMLLLMMFDMDQVTAWSAVAASLNNVGPGLAEVTMTFRDVSDSAKWVCAIAMLVGRLEIFALLLLLTPAFWER